MGRECGKLNEAPWQFHAAVKNYFVMCRYGMVVMPGRANHGRFS